MYYIYIVYVQRTKSRSVRANIENSFHVSYNLANPFRYMSDSANAKGLLVSICDEIYCCPKNLVEKVCPSSDTSVRVRVCVSIR